MANPEDSSLKKPRPIQTGNPNVGPKYEISVATLVAATLSFNDQVENYHVFTNLKEALPFDDVVAKVFFKGEDAPYAFAIQLKHIRQGETLDVEKYLKGYCKIHENGGFQTIGNIVADNIHFCYFCIKDVRTTKDYSQCVHNSAEASWRSALAFQNCYKLSYNKPINEKDKKLEDFLDKLHLYFYQPDTNKIKENIKSLCKISDATDILKYVDRFFEKGELWRRGLCKEIFEAELLRIRLADHILPPSYVIQLNELQSVTWNKVALQYNVTIVKAEADIEKSVHGCLAQMLNHIFGSVIDWNKCKANTLDASVISGFEKLSKADESKRPRHWIEPPTTLKSLLIELWKCGELPLVLSDDDHVCINCLKDYAHLGKSCIIITDNLARMREECDKYQLRAFTQISDIKCLEMRDELLKTIWVSLQGRAPITLYSVLNRHEELAATLTCSHIIHLMRTRTAYLSKECVDGDHNIIFLIEDPIRNVTLQSVSKQSFVEYNLDNISTLGGNIEIRCGSQGITEFRNQIAKHPKLSRYTIYHCAASSENENFTLIEGDKYALRGSFVDQYGESVYNLEHDVVPILGDCLPIIQQNYISRFLRKAVISTSLFDSHTKGVCFISGDLKSLDAKTKKRVRRHVHFTEIGNISLSDENVFIFIRSENIDKYWRHALRLECPLLHIDIEGANIHLCRCKNWSGLSDHISYTGQKIPEEDFIAEIIDEITVLTGEPGIGKSSLLRSLLNKHSIKKYILFYNLADYRLEQKNKSLPDDFSLNFILSKFESSRYSQFLSNLFKRRGKLVVLLDSFDEVLPSRKEDILHFIRNLAGSNIKIIIASRLIANYILVENFEVKIIKLDILRDDDCKEYTKNLGLSSEALTTIPLEFLENPLYLNFVKIILENNGYLARISKLELFRNIIQIKLDQYFQRYFSIDHESDRAYHLKHVLKLHHKLALVRILGVDAVQKLLKWKYKEKLSNQLKLGIILSIDKGYYPTFLHETFAEYLTADWIIKNCRKDTARDIYRELLKQEKLYVLDILCHHLLLHKAVLDLNKEQIDVYARDPSHLEETDALGRKAVHVAATHYKDHSVWFWRPTDIIIRNMHELEIDFTDSDILMKWNWVQHLNRGDVMELMPCYTFSTPVMEAYINGIVQTLRTNVKSRINVDQGYAVTEMYTKAMQACNINIIRDLFFIEDAKFHGVPHASTHRKCQTLKADEFKLKRIQGFTPVHVACIHGNVKVLRKLVNLKCDVNTADDFGCTPLHYSVINPPEVSTDMAKILLENGSLIDVVNRCKETATSIAIRSGNLCVTELLIQTKASTQSISLFTALEGGNRNMVELLLKYQVDPNSVNEDGMSALQFLFTPARYDSGLLKLLLSTNGTNVNYADEEGKTALLMAAKTGNLDGMKLLLEYGADANSTMTGGITPLMYACSTGNREIVRLLSEKGANVNSVAADGKTPLLFAAEWNKSDVIRQLLEKGANVNSTTTYGETPLLFASKWNNSDVVKLLLENGANVNCKTKNNCKTPLMFAAEKGNSELVALLLEKGANVDCRTTNGETALMFASKSNNADSIKLLLEKGANVNSKTTDSKTPLMFASERSNSDVVASLIERGANVNYTAPYGETALMFATKWNNTDVVKLLLKNGANVNSTTSDSKTPLVFAFERGNSEAVALLLEKGADVNCSATDGKTPLMFASIKGDSDTVELLLSKGANVNDSIETFGRTPLFFAIQGKSSDVIELLLENGASVNSTTLGTGATPLMFAAQSGELDVVELLLRRGANVNNTTTWGKTPLMFALESNNVLIIELLLEKGANVNTTTTNGKTPLMFASEEGDLEVVKLLLGKGSNVNSTTTDGKTPLIYAIKGNNSDVIKLLLEEGADVNSGTRDGERPLILASERGNLDVVKLLLRSGAVYDIITIDGASSLIVASREGNSDIVQLLLETAPDIINTTIEGETPLVLAAKRNHTRVLELLLEESVNVNSTSTDGSTPLMLASDWGNLDAVRALLGRDADVHSTTANGQTALMFAAKSGNSDVVQLLLERGADINSKTTDGTTPLMFASKQNNKDVIELLLRKGADINSTRTSDGKTPLMVASQWKNIDVMELLLKKGANVNSSTKDGETPLMFALQCDNVSIIELLLEKGANVDTATIDGKTPLMFACERENPYVIEVLLEKGANINSATTSGKTPLMFALIKGNSHIVELLLVKGASVNSTTTYGKTSLILALEKQTSSRSKFLLGESKFDKYVAGMRGPEYTPEWNNLDVVQLLLEKGANVNSAAADGTTPLILASKHDSDVVKALLDNGANVNNSTTDGVTVLMLASERYDVDFIELLLEKGANVNSTTTDGKTALMCSSIYRKTDVTKVLLEKGANVNSTTSDGGTALMSASYSGSVDISKLLLERGADINSTTADGETALMFASYSGSADISKLLLERGANVNSTTSGGETALMFASKSSSVDISKLLLERGANVNSTTADGKTALMFASKSGSVDISKLLLERGANVNSTKADGKTALMFSSIHSNTDVTKLLLEKGANVNSATADGETALMFASKSGSVDISKLLLERGANINSTTADGKTALMFSSIHSNTDVTKLLLEKGANVNSATADGETALMFASKSRSVDISKLLLERGANVNGTTVDGKTALMFASKYRSVDVAMLLLENGANINSTTTEFGDIDVMELLSWY